MDMNELEQKIAVRTANLFNQGFSFQYARETALKELGKPHARVWFTIKQMDCELKGEPKA
jgi:hypothetical protein